MWFGYRIATYANIVCIDMSAVFADLPGIASGYSGGTSKAKNCVTSLS
jgi:hypothetical protein